MTQAAFGAPSADEGSSTVEAEKAKASPSASAFPSASSTETTDIPSSTAPADADPKRFPVTPIASGTPVSAEAYNGQDASDSTLSDDEPSMDTMGMAADDEAETETRSGSEFTAPYQ